MRAVIALLAVAVLFGIVYLGTELADMRFLFAVILPYGAVAIFVVGLIYRVLGWAAVPVPFRIPTVCGQAKSLPWIKQDHLESPSGTWGVVGRMALEILLFRSLFRNTKASLSSEQRVVHKSDKYLWMGAIAFHWCLLIILLHHLRFFMEPVPAFLHGLEFFDGFFQLTAPTFLISDALIAVALLYLLGRRFLNPLVRYISLPADYFALLLLLLIVGSGIFMRYITKVDLAAVKELSMGLAFLNPVVPDNVGLPFFIHIFFVSALLAYFPFSKLVHMGGVFLSPTRNQANDNRMRRHVNPWNPEVEVHTYQQWEEEFKDKLEAAEIPLDRK